MALFGVRRIECHAGKGTRIVRSLWTNIPTGYSVELEPPETTGTWIERSSFLPAGLGMSKRSQGQIAPKMQFRRKWLDSSFEVEIITDNPASLMVHRTA